MKTMFIAMGLAIAACSSKQTEPTARTESAAPDFTPGANKKLFIDVHNLGPGKVTAQAVAEAHEKDLAKQGKYGVDYKAYFVDEKEGKIYCLVEAPSAEAALTVHKEAHGLMPDSIEEVSAGR